MVLENPAFVDANPIVNSGPPSSSCASMATLAPSLFSYKTRLEQRNKSNAVNQGAQAINTILVFERRQNVWRRNGR